MELELAEPEFAVEKIETEGRDLPGVVFHAEFEFAEENWIGANLRVVFNDFRFWFFRDFLAS